MIGNAGGKKISFDGTNVEISSSAFTLGDKSTAFISASGGQIEISSSNFHLTAGGAVTASGLLILSSSGDPIIEESGNILRGGIDGSPITDIKTGAMRATASIDSTGKVVADLKIGSATVGGLAIADILEATARTTGSIDASKNFTGNLGSSATLDGDAIADIKTGASRANTAIDSSNRFVGEIKEDTATIGSTAISTIKSKAENALEEIVIWRDEARSPDNASTDSTNPGLTEYFRADDTLKTKIVFLYRHNATIRRITFKCFAKSEAMTPSFNVAEPQILVGFTSLTDQYSGNNINSNKVSTSPTFNGSNDQSTTFDALSIAQCDGFYREISNAISISGLAAGETYQVTVQMKAGNNDTSGTGNEKDFTILAPLLTAVGSSS